MGVNLPKNDKEDEAHLKSICFQELNYYRIYSCRRVGLIILEYQLQKYFGFNSYKKGQKEVILKIMEGQSAASIFPTGAGKSLCYQLPAILLPEMTLVVSPLLSLMKDQLDFLL